MALFFRSVSKAEISYSFNSKTSMFRYSMPGRSGTLFIFRPKNQAGVRTVDLGIVHEALNAVRSVTQLSWQ
jgi:hypothetical protein